MYKNPLKKQLHKKMYIDCDSLTARSVMAKVLDCSLKVSLSSSCIVMVTFRLITLGKS